MKHGYNPPPKNLKLPNKPTPASPSALSKAVDYRTSKVHERPEPTTLSPKSRGGLDFSTSEPATFTWDNSEQKGTYFETNPDLQFVEQLKRCLENNTGGIREYLNALHI